MKYMVVVLGGYPSEVFNGEYPTLKEAKKAAKKVRVGTCVHVVHVCYSDKIAGLKLLDFDFAGSHQLPSDCVAGRIVSIDWPNGDIVTDGPVKWEPTRSKPQAAGFPWNDHRWEDIPWTPKT